MKHNLKLKFLFFTIAFSQLFYSCGLPNYSVLEPPTIVSYARNSVAFRAADDSDSSINGYIVYYKIYYDQDPLISNEADQFDPSYYENSSLSSLPNGATLPLRLGFTKLGFVNATSNAGYPLTHGSSSDIFEINFENSTNQSTGTDPAIYLNGSDMSADIGIPARGVKYNEAGFGNYTGNSTFKRYVKNYEFENSYNYEDSDIEQLLGRLGSTPNSIQIAFAVYSYTYDFTGFEELTSVPVYIGTVNQNNFSDNVANEPDLN